MKRLLPFVILILVVGGLVSAPFLLQADSHRTQLMNYLSGKLGLQVQIGKVEAKLFPPTLKLDDVTLFDTPDKPLVHVDIVNAPLDFGSLLHFRLLPSNLSMTHLVLTVRRLPNGAWDWREWPKSVSNLSSHSSWPLSRISWTQGECHWIDANASPSQELVLQAMDGVWNAVDLTVQLTGAFTGFAAPATLNFEGKGRFFASPQWSGDLRLAEDGRVCVFHADEPSEGNLEIQGESQQWRWTSALGLLRFMTRLSANEDSEASASSAMLLVWKSHFTLKPGAATFDESAGMDGGLMELKGDLSQRANDMEVHANLALKDWPIASLTSALGQGLSTDGLLTSVSTVHMTIGSSFWAGFNGAGAIDLKEGHYRFPDASIKSLTKVKTMTYLKKKYPDFQTKGLSFKRLTVHWQAAAGILTVNDAFFDAGSLRAAWVGHVDIPRHGLDGYLRLQIHETDKALRKEIPGRYIFGTPGHEEIQPILGRLQGDWNEWSLRSLPSKKIPAAVQSELRAALKTR